MYIPIDWLKNPENEKEVRSLITECSGCFHFVVVADQIESRLNELGESKILEEWKKGTFAS